MEDVEKAVEKPGNGENRSRASEEQAPGDAPSKCDTCDEESPERYPAVIIAASIDKEKCVVGSKRLCS